MRRAILVGAILVTLIALLLVWGSGCSSGFTPAPPPEPSVADAALAAPPMAAKAAPPASAAISVADVVLMNPTVPAPPPVTSSTPLPPVPDFRPVIQQPPVIPRVDPTATASDATMKTVMVSGAARQSITMPQPPARLQSPQMTQGQAPVTMESVVGVKL